MRVNLPKPGFKIISTEKLLGSCDLENFDKFGPRTSSTNISQNNSNYNNNNNNNNNNDDNYEFVVRKFHAYMFKCTLQLKYIFKKNEPYTFKNIPN